jgi:predicted DNA-binding protein (MmcQ/YjbR family)
MFRDDDFGLRELREIALTFPGAFEKVSWGRPVFCVPKIFVMYGGNAKAGAPGEMVPFPYSVLVKAEEADRAALEQDDRFYFPAYMGPSGWLGLDLTAGRVDWDEVRELVDASYRLVAPRKLVRDLDGR